MGIVDGGLFEIGGRDIGDWEGIEGVVEEDGITGEELGVDMGLLSFGVTEGEVGIDELTS